MKEKLHMPSCTTRHVVPYIHMDQWRIQSWSQGGGSKTRKF